MDPRPRVVLHVGMPKCGSSYLQEALTTIETGPEVRVESRKAAYRAAMDLLGPDRRPDLAVHGTWDRVASRAREFPGLSIISNEVFTYTGGATVRRALADLGDAEVHLVIVARDLASLLPSRWQQNIQTGSTESFATFVRRMLDIDADTPNLNPVRVARTWGRALPADRVHIVTMPARGAAGDSLWDRFLTGSGLTGHQATLPGEKVNTSLGVVSAELVRRVNEHVDRAADPPAYRAKVKTHLARDLLAGDTSARAVLPAGLLPAVTEISGAWIDQIQARGYHVCGDLQDLLPRDGTGTSGGDPDAVTDAELLRAATESLATLLGRYDEQGKELRELRELRQAQRSPQTPPRPVAGIRRRIFGR